MIYKVKYDEFALKQLKKMDRATKELIIGCVVSLGCTAGFFMTNKKSNLITE